MSAALVVELERLAAEAALSRAQLEELGHLLASCRQRIGEGVAALSAAAPAASAPERAPAPIAGVSTGGSTAASSPVATPGFDPTWGAGDG